MIKTCENCGGLYATKHFEMFAGAPCKCDAKGRLTVAPPEMSNLARRAMEEALVALATLKIIDNEKPYAEISPTLRAQIIKAHDLVVAALKLIVANENC